MRPGTTRSSLSLFVTSGALLAACGGAVLTGCGSAAGGGSVVASNAAVGANPGDDAALYVDLSNQGGDDVLVSAACACAAATSLHTTEDRDGILLMVESPGMDLPAGEEVELTPGGPHVMLEDLEEPLSTGSSIEVTLSFENSPDLLLDVPVVALEELAGRIEVPAEGDVTRPGGEGT